MSIQPQQPPLPPAGSLRCPRCSATIGPDQDWCLECGAPARTRLAQTPNWQLPTAAIGAIVLLAGAMLAFAFVKLTDDGDVPASTTPTAAATTPAVITPPAATAPVPGTTTPIPGATTPVQGTTTPAATVPVPGGTVPVPTTTPTPGTTTPGTTTPGTSTPGTTTPGTTTPDKSARTPSKSTTPPPPPPTTKVP